MPGGYRGGRRRKQSAGKRNKGNNRQNNGPQSANAVRGRKGTAGGQTGPNLRLQLNKLGLQLREIVGDGNCLFRALGDQFEGSSNQHLKHREAVVTYIREYRLDFEPFITGEDEMCFDRYVKKLSQDGTYAGNDAIVAFSRLHRCEIVVHQAGATPWRIDGGNTRQLHLAFHASRDHYSSVRRSGDQTATPTAIRLCPEVLETSAFVVDEEEEEDVFVEACGEEETYETADWVTDGDGDDLVANVMAMSGCTDEALVTEILAECEYDMALAVSRLLQLFPQFDEEQLPVENHCLEEPTNLGDDDEASKLGAASKLPEVVPSPPSFSAAQSKRQKKNAKKERAAQRRREERENMTPSANENSTSLTPDSEFVINGLTVLNL